MHYQRAYVDRAATRDGEPLEFIAATEGRKVDGIDLRMRGARLERFRANPVFGYGHRYGGRGDLPIGRAVSTDVEGDRLRIAVEFDQDDEFARTVERKYRGGYLNAVSVGFDVTRWEGGRGSYLSGGVAEEWELNELSAVPVPVDGSAVVASGRSLAEPDVDRALVRALVAEFGEEAVLAAVRTRLFGETPDPKPEPSAPARVAEIDAARGLLAVLTEKE